jgi:hypothetical protein
VSTNTQQERFVAFPANVWENAGSKEELEKWLATTSEEDEMSPVVIVTDYLREICIQLQLFPNGDILAVLPNTDLAADGTDFEEAKQNLLLAIQDDYAYLSQRRDALGPEHLAQLKFLEEKFV